MTIEPTTLLAITVIFIGSYVQTAIGFGLAIVSAPLLIVYAPQYVPAPICLIALFISLLNALKHRSSIEIGGLKMAILGRVPGSIAGAALLLYVSSHVLTLWIGLLVLLAVVVSVLPYRIEPTPRRMVIAGFFSGLFGTSSAIGGPPMAILLQHQEANQLRGNLSAFFVFSSIISLTAQIPVGFLSLDKLWITLPLIPSAWLGYWLALKTTQSLPKEKIRYAALILCLICGIIAIYESIY
ncbi:MULTISPECIES: sulfite exporter TauE/SafE family protein [unclassified Photobacterium]|uniref:sulfite exporter TauE/SafE family protein n=1 Tax=unclassified Photobacterium TaxID=2628852 RepID=UPI001EDECB64|nr:MULTISPECIES: sulfite exporter TauE/SafE family protein [unclassified Photobacterium]MCG3863368.1 sulfite exporter TauE/SafE family protein [Photobacterium sp. Ph6]MCG3874897.1 sulfite exporter TauE/SafE family protein [Photobacterium sp. Ph5]